MIKSPRKPYRSPFWRPEFGEPDGGGRTRASEPTIPTIELQPRPSSPARRTVERFVAERSTAYTHGDLALFGRLMAFDDRPREAEPRHGPPSAKPQMGGDQARSKPDRIADRRAGRPYSSQDAKLFQSLESGMAGNHAPPKAAQTAASRLPGSPSHGYSQSDLDAFDELTRFVRSAKS